MNKFDKGDLVVGVEDGVKLRWGYVTRADDDAEQVGYAVNYVFPYSSKYLNHAAWSFGGVVPVPERVFVTTSQRPFRRGDLVMVMQDHSAVRYFTKTYKRCPPLYVEVVKEVLDGWCLVPLPVANERMGRVIMSFAGALIRDAL